MEDQPELASYWRETLEDAGYIVLHAADFEEASSLLESREVQVVVSDMLIRDGNNNTSKSGGLTLLSHISLNVDPAPKMIAVSGAHPDLHILRHAELFNAAASIIKPFTAEELLDTVKRVLEK